MCQKNVKWTNFLVNTWVFKAQNAPKPAGKLMTSPNPLVGWGGGHPPHSPPLRRLRRLDLAAFGASLLTP